MGNYQNKIWWLPSFFTIPATQECISTHKVRAQLDIVDVIQRGLGMCLQQANSVRVITKALLANLRSNNDCGLGAPPFIKEKKDIKKRKCGQCCLMCPYYRECREDGEL